MYSFFIIVALNKEERAEPNKKAPMEPKEKKSGYVKIKAKNA